MGKAKKANNGGRSGKARRSSRSVASMSVVVLLALMMVTAGVGGGFLLTRSRIPASLVSTTDSGTLRVAPAQFDDSRSVALAISLSTSSTVMSPISGTVTSLRCTGTVNSGGTMMSVDAKPILALHTTTPPYRTLTSGMQGMDAKALNQALRQLGYQAPNSSWMTWDTITAYNALADTIGAQRLTKQTNWSIQPDSFMWLPSASLSIASCATTVGQHVTAQQEVFTSGIVPVRATLSSGSSDIVSGDRLLTINGRDYAVSSGTKELNKAEILNAISSSVEYHASTLATGSTASKEAGGSGSMGNADGTIDVTYRWRLKKPITTITIPPSAIYDASSNKGCVTVGEEGKPAPVRIIASQLGKTMVTPDNGKVWSSVKVKPVSTKPCR